MKFELTKKFLEDISDKIDLKEFDEIKDSLSELHSIDIAELIEELDEERGKILFEIFEDEDSADIFIELDEENRESVLEDLTSQEIAEELIENLDSDDAADIISELTSKKKVEVLSHIEDLEHASDIVDLLSYPENTAGGLMAKELIKVNQKWTALRCVVEMRKQAEDVDQVYSIYVVDDNAILLGTLSLKKTTSSFGKNYYKNYLQRQDYLCKSKFR
jgi:magnesium transporter